MLKINVKAKNKQINDFKNKFRVRIIINEY